MHFIGFRIMTRLLLFASLVFIGAVACRAGGSPTGMSPDTTHHFVSHTFGIAFTPPPGCTVKMSGESGYFHLEGKDDPQFRGHVEDLNAFFQDNNYAGRLAQGKVTFKSVAESNTGPMYEARGDAGTATGRVDSIHHFTSPAGLEVVVVYVAQVFDFFEPDSVNAFWKRDNHYFVVWVDISHEGKPLALILQPQEADWNPKKAWVRTMDIVNSLTLVPFKDDK